MVAELYPSDLPSQLVNLRDVGRLPLDGGGHTRSGVLWRSGAPLADDLPPDLPQWPPATVLDLRGHGESAETSHPLEAPGTTILNLPLLEAPVAQMISRWAKIPDLGTAYRGFMEQGGEKLAQIVDIVANRPGPVLVHCTAGKDRTGVVVAALLRAVGVTRSAIVTDYRATEPALPAIIARASHLTDRMDPTVAQRMMGVQAPAVLAVLDVLDGHPDGAWGWLRAAGAREDDLIAWRHRIVPVGQA
ncbi:MAG TPA: tyrosine-protein phosphatase [Pseudonocardia sp.]|jgi:hypothetical protein|nr:tyrosine-protein phosphatase [Pseudonocardia sp.]